MILNQNIIKSALLGLKAKPIQPEYFPAKVQPFLTSIKNEEDRFLDGLSLTFQYLTSGKELPKIEKLSSQGLACPKEELPYASEQLTKAFEAATRADFLPYSYHSFLQLIAEKLIAEKWILPPEKLASTLSKIIELRAKSKQKFKLDPFYKLYNPQKSYPNSQQQEDKLVAAFGKTGRWIFEMMSPAKKVDAEELDAKGRRALFQQYCLSDSEKVVPFLENLFAHERLNNQQFFLKTIAQSNLASSPDVHAFFMRFFAESTVSSKRLSQLKQSFQTFELLAFPKHALRPEMEAMFENIWEDRGFLSKNLKLKSKKKLSKILAPLDEYDLNIFYSNKNITDLNLKLLFLFNLIPIPKACNILKIKPKKYISELVSMVSFSRKESFDPIHSLIQNILKTQDKEAARLILKLSKKTEIMRPELLLVLSDDEILDFLEHNFEIIEYSNRDIFELLIIELNCKATWSEKFTALMLDHILSNQYFYGFSNRFQEALWLGGPFYHKNAHQIVKQVAQSPQHKDAWKREEIQSYLNNVLEARLLEVRG